MGGKSSILIVIGFSSIFVIVGLTLGNMSSRAVDNMSNYYTESMAYNIAVSGANVAANKIFTDPTWTTGYDNVSFNGGSYSVIIEIVDAFRNIRKINSIGSFEGITKMVEITLQPSKFSKFAYYSRSEGGNIWWTTGDTVWGPFHTQDHLRVYGSPVFMGKTTINGRLIEYPFGRWGQRNDPQFWGGFETGINLPQSSDGLNALESAAASGGIKVGKRDTVYINFDEENINYKFSYTDEFTTVTGNEIAPNGVIYVKDGIIRLSGTVQGQYSVVASGKGWKGKIFLDDNIEYKSNPMDYPNSTDMLGIIAENDVIITDNNANRNDININASIYCQDGSFYAENYDSRPPSGNINLIGGVIQNKRGPVGTFNNRGISAGFNKRYRYDERFMVGSPPMFPGTGGFEIVSWYE